jgi:hypothetical protein
MKLFAVAAFCLLAPVLCPAEPRWCAVSQKNSSYTLVYPPIARAARVQGVVVMRMIYEPNGKVGRTEPVFGPVMLADSVTKQLLNRTVKTDATGNEQCVTLVIAEFRILDPDGVPQFVPAQPSSPGILRILIESEVIIISDPAGTLTTANPFRAFAHKVGRLAKRLSGG